jgi:hypothetical protein
VIVVGSHGLFHRIDGPEHAAHALDMSSTGMSVQPPQLTGQCKATLGTSQ